MRSGSKQRAWMLVVQSGSKQWAWMVAVEVLRRGGGEGEKEDTEQKKERKEEKQAANIKSNDLRLVACPMWIDVTSTAWRHKTTQVVLLAGDDGSSSRTAWK